MDNLPYLWCCYIPWAVYFARKIRSKNTSTTCAPKHKKETAGKNTNFLYTWARTKIAGATNDTPAIAEPNKTVAVVEIPLMRNKEDVDIVRVRPRRTSTAVNC
jgi:hypothetical protein